jgi:hypothetical protein
MSDSMKNGGPAFPLHLPAIMGEPDTYWNGMTLRDWFAGQALVGLLSLDRPDASIVNVAYTSYRFADAMLEARNEEVAP